MTRIRSQRGLAAAAIILVIILGVVTLMLGRGFFQPAADLGRREVTAERMTRITKALVDFAKLQARLPCPARDVTGPTGQGHAKLDVPRQTTVRFVSRLYL